MNHLGRLVWAPAVAAGLLALSAGPAAADIPPPTPSRPPGTEGLTTLLNWGMWLVTFAGIVGVFIAAGSMMLSHRRGEGGEQASKLGWVLGGCCVAAASAPVVNMLL
ncbi:MAG: hypothetical protein MUF09_10080 [Candidatus Nanopelagicales bacterium]|jgi:hypothetical protein|nr:hypothetical protein [Candidatus Nanopelagicales bacterium]